MRRADKTFSCPWLFIYPIFKKGTVQLVENSNKCNYFLDGKRSMGNFDNPDLHIDFHDWENHTCTRKLLLNIFQTS